MYVHTRYYLAFYLEGIRFIRGIRHPSHDVWNAGRVAEHERRNCSHVHRPPRRKEARRLVFAGLTPSNVESRRQRTNY